MIPSLDILKAVVCSTTGVSAFDFEFGRRTPKNTDARKLLVVIAMDICHYRQCEVTKYMHYDHSSIDHMRTTGQELLEVDPRINKMYHKIKAAIELKSSFDEMPKEALVLRMKILRQELDDKINELDTIIETLSNHEYTNQ